MELKKNSWHARLYKMHNTYFPDSLCNYFWAIVLYVAIFPLEMVSMFTKDLRTSHHIGARALISSLIWLILLTPMVDLVNKEFTISTYFGALFRFLSISLIVMGSLATLGGLIYGIGVIVKRRNDKSPGPTLVGEWWRGFKGKYCPAINWK